MRAAAKTISISGDRKKNSILNHFGSSFQRPSRINNNGEKVSQEMNRAMVLSMICFFIFSSVSFHFGRFCSILFYYEFDSFKLGTLFRFMHHFVIKIAINGFFSIDLFPTVL